MKFTPKTYLLLLSFSAPFMSCFSQTTDTKAKEEFKKFDITANGYLSGSELTTCNCKAYDTDGDGRVTDIEFYKGKGSNLPAVNQPANTTTQRAKQATKKTGDYYSGYNMGMRQTTYYYFLPDNKVVWGCIKSGLEQFNITAENPRNVGTYSKTGNTVSITWNDGSSMNGTLKSNGMLDINAGEAAKAIPIETLSGNYISEIGGGGATAVETHQFNSKGRFIIDKIVSFDNGDGNWGSETATNKKGSFTIDGFTITLNFDNGTTEKHTVFSYSTSNNPDHIGWDCEFLTKKK